MEKLQLTTIKVRTIIEIDDEWLKRIVSSIKHDCTGVFIDINTEKTEVDDDRNLPNPPRDCVGCKWLKNKECWHKGEYYGNDFGDQDECYEKQE